jgi:hypothetical protein
VRDRQRERRTRSRLAEAAGWAPRSPPLPAEEPGARPRRLLPPPVGVAAGQGQPSPGPRAHRRPAAEARRPRARVMVVAGQRQPSRLLQAGVAERPRLLRFPPSPRRPRSSRTGARPEAAEASEPHPAGAEGPHPAAEAAWARPHPEVVAAPLGAGVAWARPHPAVPAAEVVSARRAEAGASPPVGAVAWRRGVPAASAPRGASGAHRRKEASAVHRRPAVSAARPPHQASAARPRAGRAVLASASPPAGHDRPHPCTAPTATVRTSHASAVPLPPRVPRPGPARGPPSPPSIPGTPRTTRRTRRLPCCGNRSSCTRSRPVHLHSVHDVCRLGARHRRVDQVHWHA